MTQAENTRKIKHIGCCAKNQRDNTGYLDNEPTRKKPTQQDYQNFNPIKQQKGGIYLPTHRKTKIDYYTLPESDGSVRK